MPMRRASVPTAVLVAALVLASAAAADVPPSILGRSFVVRDSSAGIDATRRRVAVTAKEASSPTALQGDPTAVGAALAVDTLPGVTQVLELPASAWRAVRGGFRYDDHGGTYGAVVRVLVRRDARGTFTLKTALSGARAQLDLVPPNPGTDGELALLIHDGFTYCTHFGGEAGGTVTNTVRLFKVTHPTALGPCPWVVLSTLPSTTSTSSTSTTSTSTTSSTSTTIVGPPCGEINGASFCWGECPPETPICADVGGTCLCVSGTQPCGGVRGTACDGACPPGQACVSGGLDCGCMPVDDMPCYNGQPGGGPTCGGFCPPDETCGFLQLPNGVSGCVCGPPTCFGPFHGCSNQCQPGRSCDLVDLGGGLFSCLCLL